MGMTSKERVKTAFSHKQADRVPTFSSFTTGLGRRLRKDLNITEKDLGVAMGNDMIEVKSGIEAVMNMSEDLDFVCPWGIHWRKVQNQFGSYTEIVENPLAGDDEKLTNWNAPDPTKEKQYEAMKQTLDTYGKNYWITGSCRCSIFETAWFLRGMENFLVDLISNEDYANELLDKITEYPRFALKEFIRLGADMVWMGDDVATQLGLMISPAIWRKYFKPRYEKLFKEFRELNPDIIIAYHSCGNCFDLVEDLIEIGLDVLHPLQPQAIDPIVAKEKFGDRLTLMGGLDIQLVMPNGSPKDVREETIRLIKGCGKGGGFILGGAHHFQEDTSTENIITLYKTLREEGAYDRISFDESVDLTPIAFQRLHTKLQG
jgi:uroporphyrinogen decarboxylase